jgi:phosphate starvation-inducible PhoH-like protein
MATKRVTKKRKESDELENEFFKEYKKNYDCANIEIKKLPHLTPNHLNFYYTTQRPNTNVVFVNGVAGSAKTFIAVYSALELLKNRKVDQIIYIRSVVESSSRSIGALPGELNEKFAMYTTPLIDKLQELVDHSTIKTLFDQGYIKAIPINFVRGVTFHNSVVIFDEAQNANRSEITTVLTRIGRGTKYFILGDSNQSDIKDSGFKNVYELFDQDFSRKNDIHCFKFDHADVVRSPILKHIAQILNV